MKQSSRILEFFSGALRPQLLVLLVAVELSQNTLADNAVAPDNTEVALSMAQKATTIPLDQIGAVAGKQYSGDGLAVEATDGGAQLRCVFQRMEGEVTRDGLWLKSTVPDQINDRFQVKAMAVGEKTLPDLGNVSVDGQTVRFSRAGLVEEYTVSMDGVRQDFLVLEKPGSSGRESAPSQASSGKSEPTHVSYRREGELRMNLAVSGARVEQTVNGAQLVLEKSGRKIAYSRLNVTDATGKELPARIEVASNSVIHSQHSELAMAVVVDDTDAIYPVRIDPTFSDANWVSMGGIVGASGTVRAVAVDSLGNLYIGGDFTAVGETNASRIAKWDGSAWAPLGLGVNGSVSALAASGSDLCVGGAFSIATNSGGVALTVNRIAHWNGSAWSALGSGMNNSVLAVAVSGTDVYAGGSFTTAGGGAANRIAKWNGVAWSALATGMDNSVWALSLSGSNLYAGGFFTNAGGVAVNRIAKWDGSGWSALGSGMNNFVGALAVLGTNLYAGGTFTNAGGNVANYIARWNGSIWSPLGSGMNGNVIALAVSGSNVFVGGAFTTAGGNSAYYIAKWDGNNWSSVGTGVGSYVYALTASGSNVYAGGEFTSAGGKQAYRVAKWDGSNWGGLGSGINDPVYALAVLGSDVYAGGWFTTLGGGAGNYVAKWDGSGWSALGSGMNDGVFALEVSGSNVYAAGNFTNAGGVMANRIAKWNGVTWTPLGVGMDGAIEDLIVLGDDLYAGGIFNTAGGSPANGVAKWNGSNWSAVGSGMTGVRCLAQSGTDLYAGSYYYVWNGGPVPVGKVAKWDGSSWFELGSGMNDGVFALAVSGNNVYAGGWFTTAGGFAANRIAKWNGSSWSALGSGLNYRVEALAMLGSNVYVGGGFTTAGGSSANRISKWDGSSWSPLGSGLDGSVEALALSGNNLYVGGGFTTAGGKISGNIAKAILPGDSPQITDQPDSLTNLIGSTAILSVAATGTDPLTYRWRKNGTNLLNDGNISGATTTNLNITNVHSTNAGDYMVVVTNAYGSVTSSIAVLTVSAPPPPGVVPGLYFTNAVILPNKIAQFEVRTPLAGSGFALMYSFDLQKWYFWTELTGTNRYFLQSPGPISDFASLFLRAAPLGQAKHDFYFRFRNSWNGPLAGNAPALAWPQPFQNWQAVLDSINSTNLPSANSVLFNGPAGSGLVNLPTSFSPDDTHAGSYESDFFTMPPSPPGGTWTIPYGTTSLNLSEPDPQTSIRSVTIVPSFVISNGQVHAVSWSYRNPTTGAVLASPPSFISRMSLDVYGADYSQCSENDSGVFYRDIAGPAITNCSITPPLPWDGLLFQFEYFDTFNNLYTLNYCFGNRYQVFGANSYSGIDYCDPTINGFTLLGSATNTATINGSYNYYLIRAPKHNLVKVDTVRGSNGAYFGTSITGNTENHLNIGGVPDNLYATLGQTPRGFHTGGIVLINASGQGLSSITVYTVP